LVNDDGRLHISAPIYGPLLGQNVIWLTRRLDRPGGGFGGVIAINILPEQFTAFYSDAQVNQQDMVSVVGLDGIVRARRVGDTITSGEDVRSGEVTRLQMEGRQLSGTHLGLSRHDATVRYVSHRRLQNYPLFVAYGVLESEVLAASRYRARIFFAGGVMISLFIIAFAALFTLYLSRRDRQLVELARTNRRLQEAQRIGDIGDWDYDLRTGETTWSPQLLAMYGREELGSPTLEEFRSYLDDEGKAVVERAHADAIRTGEAQEIDYAVRLPGGGESHHQSAVIPTVDAKGEVVRLHGTDQDVTGRKMLDLLQTQVAHLSRIEAMNAMAATLAHELNQPLTAASNYLVGSRRRLSAEGADAPEEVAQGMAAAEQQIHLAADIIRRVREMVSNPPRAAAAVSLTPVIEDALALISVGTVCPNTRIVKTIAADAETVTGDRIQIQQVMINLVRNACDATQGMPDARITIESRRVEGDMVATCVTDNGVGFSQPQGERFSPFATTKGSGLGLGLSISRTIIEAHGGRIWTEDRSGGGASVCFTLPAPGPRPIRKPKAKSEG
jgi:C4-dicarboxylate-specific signal transduction histidine kinase